MKLEIDQTVKPFYKFIGGYNHAIQHLNHFFDNLLIIYDKRSDPSLHIQSFMSMYLQFGQIADQDILQRLYEHPLYQHHLPLAEQFIEQLIVRRALAYNFVTYNEGYDQFNHMTENWAYETMKQHAQDIRTPYI